MKRLITLKVNGELYEVAVEPQTTLLEVLREDLDLTGTKDGCSLGSCGACTVLIEGKPILSCLFLALDARGKDILTIEGLSKDGRLHPLQEAFIRHGAIQCGFCTPGVILTAKSFLDENPSPTVEEVKEALSGNICRCTGYVRIIKATMLAACEGREKRE